MSHFGYVMATKMLVEKKLPVHFMYREESQGDDSGWRFFCGLEEQAYVDDPDNLAIYDVQTILDIDPGIRPYLSSKRGMVFERVNDAGLFTVVQDFDFAPEDGETV
jgi:hypothetical protein